MAMSRLVPLLEFNHSLRFGDQIPFSGSFRDGTLELRYYQDPGVKVGQ